MRISLYVSFSSFKTHDAEKSNTNNTDWPAYPEDNTSQNLYGVYMSIKSFIPSVEKNHLQQLNSFELIMLLQFSFQMQNPIPKQDQFVAYISVKNVTNARPCSLVYF